MNNLILKDIKNIYENYFVLIIIIIFISIYFVINYNKVMDNNFSAEDFVNPVLITCVIVLICNLVIFTDNCDSDFDIQSSDHNIYKIINKDSNNERDDNFEDIKEQKIYKILNDDEKINKNSMKLNNDTNKDIVQNNSDNDEKYLNKNIFLPYKNNNVKFQLKT